MPVSSSTMRILGMLGTGGGRHIVRNNRKLNNEACSQRLVFFYPNRPVMFFDHAADDCKTEAGSAFSGGKIRQKQFLFQLTGEAVTGVGNRNLHGVAAGH